MPWRTDSCFETLPLINEQLMDKSDKTENAPFSSAAELQHFHKDGDLYCRAPVMSGIQLTAHGDGWCWLAERPQTHWRTRVRAAACVTSGHHLCLPLPVTNPEDRGWQIRHSATSSGKTKLPLTSAATFLIEVSGKTQPLLRAGPWRNPYLTCSCAAKPLV